MADLERLQDAFLKADSLAQQGDQQAKRDAAMFAAEIKRIRASGAQAPKATPVKDFMGQVNAGIGDIIDFVNPFDTPAVSQALGMGDRLSTGSAADAMNAVGINAATEQPEGFLEGMGRGAGQAAASFPAVVQGLRALSTAGGAVGAAADDALSQMMTRLGLTAEVAAGGLSRGAEEAVEAQGGGELAQGIAAVAAPMSIPAMAGSARLAGRAAEKTPLTGAAIRMGRDVKRALVPMTEGGAREVARERLVDLAGSPQRAEALSNRISGQDEFGRTPAEQIGDSNFLGLQDAVANENPEVAARLESRANRSQANITEAARDMGGNVGDARAFFRQRQAEFKEGMQARVDGVLSGAQEGIEGAGPRNSEAINSERVVTNIKAELDVTRQENASLWAAVPLETDLSGGRAAQLARETIKSTARARQEDIPATIRQALEEGNELAGPTTANELHGLYSKLRQIARNARAGTQTNTNMARIADDMAEAILEDLGTGAPEGELGSSLREAIAHTRAMHETFDQGATGRILRRTTATDEQIAPETALDRTVGRGGNAAFADDINLRNAAGQNSAEVGDYLRSRFSEAVMDASGDVRLKTARTWLRNNREILSRYPELRKELMGAVNTQDRAEAFAIRAQERMKLADQGPLGDFNSGQTQKAITAILGADDPLAAAKSITATARKDTSGKALAGVKGAFTDYLTRDPGKFSALLQDKQVSAAMREVFSPEEMRRLRRIGIAQARMSQSSNDVGSVLNSPANQMIEFLVRYMAVQQTSGAGSNAGAQLQIANMASGRAKRLVANLTNDKARRILVDAVQDPELFKELMRTTPKRFDPQKSRLAPYLLGTGAAQAEPYLTFGDPEQE